MNSASSSRGERREVEAKRDVFQHRHRLEQREVLEHHADAEPARRARIGDANGRAVEDDLALVGREDAVDHLDQGRFSRAILAEKRMNLAGLDAQVDVVVRADARKGLADADELQAQGSFDVHLNFTSLPSPIRAATQKTRRPVLRPSKKAVRSTRDFLLSP